VSYDVISFALILSEVTAPLFDCFQSGARASMRTAQHLRPCNKGYLPSNEVELLGGRG
jgi:hypothetical protein